jgi:Leucine-rich repeat (LRR) protein
MDEEHDMVDVEDPVVDSYSNNASDEKKPFCTKIRCAVVALLLTVALGVTLGVVLGTQNKSTAQESNNNLDSTVTYPPASFGGTTVVPGDTTNTAPPTTATAVVFPEGVNDILSNLTQSLPASTQTALDDPGSHASQGLMWLANHPDLESMPQWRMHQLLALSTFYYAFNGDMWGPSVKSSWLDETTSECEWITPPVDYLSQLGGGTENVMIPLAEQNVLASDLTTTGTLPPTCNENGEYQHLSLSHLEIRGQNAVMPPEIALLTSLETIDIRNGNITANIQDLIPSELAAMPKLTSLDYAANSIQGTLPAETIGLLTNLEALHLGLNLIQGDVPSELGLLSNNLKQLNLGFNMMVGPFPSVVTKLTALESLQLSNNQFFEAIASDIGKLGNLKKLYFNHNWFVEIPSELGLLTSLEELVMDQNPINIPLPTELGSIGTSLKVLHMNGCAFSGNIPIEYGQLVGLESLEISGNQLSGPMPTQLGGLVALTNLGLTDNALTGPIPSEFGLMTTMTELLIGNNQLTMLPSEIGNMRSLTSLGAINNAFVGAIGSEIGTLTDMEKLLLSDNQFTSTIPSELGQLSKLLWLYLNDNKVRENGGCLSYMSCFCHFTNILRCVSS